MRGDVSPLDPTVIEALRQLNAPGQPDVLQEVLGLFVADAPGRLATITAAADARDGSGLQRAAHALKGASATIGASTLQAHCRALEEMGKQQTFDGASEAIAALSREYQRVRAAIDQLL